jgi:pimeloyl-ACP methyl ester carboxylesterase
MGAPEAREITLRDGRRLAYAEFGSPRGTPIVHCHGSPSSRVEGELLFDKAAITELGLRLIVPDRPGMGRSDFQAGRRIVDWPNDVSDLATALDLQDFFVLGESGGSPYALACGALMPTRVRAVGVVGGVAPLEAPGLAAALSTPLRLMFRLAKYAPPLLGALFRLNLKVMRSVSERGVERMLASFPEPDRTLLKRPEVLRRFIACFQEACLNGTRGAVHDMGLLARPWGFDPGLISVPVRLWHGDRDGNVPVTHGRYLAETVPRCRASFYPDDAHLSVPLNHGREILSALRST